MSIIITDCNHSTMLTPRLYLLGFWPGFETKRLAIVNFIWYCANIIKLVSLTWHLWAMRGFQRFTLHYVNYETRFPKVWKSLPQSQSGSIGHSLLNKQDCIRLSAGYSTNQKQYNYRFIERFYKTNLAKERTVQHFLVLSFIHSYWTFI